jgi:glutamate synthase (NADPH) large chain
VNGLYDPQTEHDACGVGFVANIKGDKSRAIVVDALEVLRRLSHRAASGRDPETGDGAGILLQLSHRFFRREGLALGFDMPRSRRYAIGQVFLPQDPRQRELCQATFEEVVREEGLDVIGWRDVPIAPEHTGVVARSVMPVIRQIYVRLRRLPPTAFERKLFIIRKIVENRVRSRELDPDGRFHIASFSSETIVYKGLLLPKQLPLFFEDLQAEDMESAIALVHSRFSTNTFPTWDLAQPFRYLAHNGEINTLRGNENWMLARRSQLHSSKFGDLSRLFPIFTPGGSDSAKLDNMLELLHLGGRTVPHAMMMMIPEAWEGNVEMRPERRDFYRYAASLMEPWDGPAAIAFTDGHIIGATLDRNGLRPARYIITDDGRAILASECGVIDVPEEKIVTKGRLTPGKMFLVDTEQGRVLDDEELKSEIANRWPYKLWLEQNVFELDELPERPIPSGLAGDALRAQQRAFGYTDETLRLILGPMAEDGKEPVGSMGNDTPLAVLSDRAPNLFSYFHQLFAQVTNPPIDPIREAMVMTLETTIGPDGNTFEETPEQCHSIRLAAPILTSSSLAKLMAVEEGVFESTKLSLLYEASEDPISLERAVAELSARATRAVDDGFNLLVLSDRGVDEGHLAIPSLLAVSAVQQHLVREGIRMQVGLVVETGEAREVHDIALLIGFGAAAVNPYLALDSVRALAREGLVSVSEDHAEERYVHALEEGLLKVMSKMGISTLASYRGAQIFEAVGLSRALIDRHFTGTPSRLDGIGLDEIGREVSIRHRRAFSEEALAIPEELPVGGEYQWRRRGEIHKWNPATIAKLQAAARSGSKELFEEYTKLVDEEDGALVTLRALIDLVEAPISIEEVEPASSIVKRFVTGAMSFGSISAEAHETIAIAMNRMGGRSNSGEGGEESRRYVPDENGDLRRSAIKQVASARFGVTAEYLVNAEDLQIKIAQGAKPGEGGQLPGHKVDERIAKVRCSTPGVTLISPPPHHDIYSIEDLAQLIYDLQTVNPRARVSVKLVSEVGVGTIAAGVAKARAGCVVIAGDAGGTGASPISSLKHAGLPWELGLAETQQVLVKNGLRGRVRLQVDGGIRTGRDVVIAALLGAEEFGVATAALIVSGCVMLRKCHLNTCSVGIATQDPELRRLFAGTPEEIVAFFFLLAEDVRRHMAEIGFRTIDEMVGRADRLRPREVDHWKAKLLNLSPILHVPKGGPRRLEKPMPWPLDDHVDHQVMKAAGSALDAASSAQVRLPITNADRAAGALLSGEIARRHGGKGLPQDTITVRFAGSAGQSFGAFLASGVTLELDGDANDYVGKGLSGGRIVVRPPKESRFVPEENVIIGNTALYGATSGDLFARGLAGERFAVRNSGARAVVEGVGDHGCEYMTGGVVVVLGKTGRNFGAGMSGGIAYVFDRERRFRRSCNTSMVDLEAVSDESEVWMLRGLIEDHVRLTQSALGARILAQWPLMLPSFVKVMPHDYKRVLEAQRSKRPIAAAGGMR